MFVKARALLAAARVRRSISAAHLRRGGGAGGGGGGGGGRGRRGGGGGGRHGGRHWAVEFVTRVQPAENCASTLEATVAALLVPQPAAAAAGRPTRPPRAMMRFQLGQGSLSLRADGGSRGEGGSKSEGGAEGEGSDRAGNRGSSRQQRGCVAVPLVGAPPVVDVNVPLLATDAKSQPPPGQQ